jgi:glycerophosphoryl diester phosphodiesterase
LAELQRYGAAYAGRFGTRFRGVPFATLDQLCGLLRRHNQGGAGPPSRAFVELKAESARQCGYPVMVDKVAQGLARSAHARDIAAVISMDLQLCAGLRAAGWPIGWVIPAWDEQTRQQATATAPQFLFCDHRIFPRHSRDIWSGPWKWVIYTLNDPALLEGLPAEGVDLVETDCFDRMMQPSVSGYTARPSTL